jgi:sugar phosphate isomerase/epimerase
VQDLHIEIDGSARDVAVILNGRAVTPGALGDEHGWWYVQDRLELVGGAPLAPGAHEISVSFRLVIPYLQSGPDGPLVLPFSVSRSLAPTPGWTLSASAFNLTPLVIEAEQDAATIAESLLISGTAREIEAELGQLWRSFPSPTADEGAALRERLARHGGRVSIVGGSIDDWASPDRRRSDDERLAFLLPQLRVAAALGARGIRLPLGQAGRALLERLLPALHELDLVLFEEAQGQESPANPSAARAYETIFAIDDPHLRLLLDSSMLMPALPVTYLERMAAAGLDTGLLARVRDEWLDPATLEAVMTTLRSGGVPPEVHTLFMNLLVRFGRTSIDELTPILPLIGGVHLKFWDLDDADRRVSRPIAELGAALASTGFAGTLCSEWGGHEWLDDDPLEMTRAHLALAHTALAGAYPSPL